MNELAGLKSNPVKGIYSFKTNEEVLKYVSENEGMIGVVGLNWLYRPAATVSEYLKKLNVLSVKGIDKMDFIAPTQNNLAEGTYPLARDLYIINCQGCSGLGMGFCFLRSGRYRTKDSFKVRFIASAYARKKNYYYNKLSKKVKNENVYE